VRLLQEIEAARNLGQAEGELLVQDGPLLQAGGRQDPLQGADEEAHSRDQVKAGLGDGGSSILPAADYAYHPHADSQRDDRKVEEGAEKFHERSFGFGPAGQALGFRAEIRAAVGKIEDIHSRSLFPY